MKSLFPAILIAAAAAVFSSSQPNQAARPSAPALEATPVVAVASPAPSPAPSPNCDCDACDCLACSCEPLTVGRPPDLVHLVDLVAKPAPQIRSEPPPGLIVPTSHPSHPSKPTPPAPAASIPAAAGGQWVTRRAGLRGRRSYVEWIPHNTPAASQPPAAACNFGGACRSCR